ncbi:nuclease [Mortierella alpina]|nr:nuclease [Mortierella alpina]
MSPITPYSQQRLTRTAIFICGMLFGSLAVIGLSPLLSSSPSEHQHLFRRSGDGISECDHRLHIVERNDLLAPLPSNVAERVEFKFGYPGPVADINAAQRFVSVYDRRTRNPHWSAEYLTKQNILAENSNEETVRKDNFREDTTIPPQFRARLSTYTASGYDRGHQAPAADAKLNQAAMNETFLLSNMAPQVGIGFNRHYWANLEKFARELTNTFDHVFVITGPLYMPEASPSPPSRKTSVTYEVLYSDKSDVAPISVPTHFYKVILVINGDLNSPTSTNLGSFILPNAVISNKKPLTDFVTPLDKIEVSAGVVFFDKIDRANAPGLCDAISCKL